MMAGCLPSRLALPMSPSSHHAAAVAAQAAALEQLREKLEGGEPPEKRMMMVAEEQQRIMQHALQQNLLAMATQLPLNIKLNNRGEAVIRFHPGLSLRSFFLIFPLYDQKNMTLCNANFGCRKLPKIPRRTNWQRTQIKRYLVYSYTVERLD